jgi:hypothetical protein
MAAIGAINVMTTLQLASDAINFFADMTCLYNKDWYPEQSRATLPVCMFYVKKITETWQNETSKKRVLLFEPQKEVTPEEAASPIREGVMKTIVDNIVAQPKTYAMEIILPYLPLGYRLYTSMVE